MLKVLFVFRHTNHHHHPTNFLTCQSIELIFGARKKNAYKMSVPAKTGIQKKHFFYGNPEQKPTFYRKLISDSNSTLRERTNKVFKIIDSKSPVIKKLMASNMLTVQYINLYVSVKATQYLKKIKRNIRLSYNNLC